MQSRRGVIILLDGLPPSRSEGPVRAPPGSRGAAQWPAARSRRHFGVARRGSAGTGGGGLSLRSLEFCLSSLSLFASLPLCLNCLFASCLSAFLPLFPSFPPSPSRSNKRSPVPPPPCLEGVQILREGWESEPGWPDPCSKGDKWLWCWRVAMSAPCGFPLCIPRVT